MSQNQSLSATCVIQYPMRAHHKALVGITGLGLTAAGVATALTGEWVFTSIFADLGIALLASLTLMLQKTRLQGASEQVLSELD